MINEDITKLFRAVEERDCDAVRQALETSKTPDLVNAPCGAMRITALHIASILDGDGALRVVNLLLENGAKPTVRDRLGRTPLHHAATLGRLQLVSRFIEAGSPIDAKFEVNSWKETQNYCNESNVHKKFPSPDCWGRTALHQAVKNCHYDVVKLLVLHGADVNIADERGTTPLLLTGAGLTPTLNDHACAHAYEQMVHLLISAGADVNVSTHDTRATALHHAVVLRNFEVVSELLKAGARLYSTTCGETPLHSAAGLGWTEAVEAMLYSGGKYVVNKPDDAGRTALHRAAYSGSRDCVRVLLDNGANLAAQTTVGVTVVDVVLAHIPRPVNFLTEVLDSKFSCNHIKMNDVDFKVNIDFRILAPQGPEKQMSVISAILTSGTDHQQIKLLQHPLLETYIRIKWHRLSFFFYLFLLVHIIFVLSFSVYIMILINDGPQTCLKVFQGVLFVSSAWLTLHSLLQAVLVPKHYLRQPEFYLNIMCGAFALTVASAANAQPQEWALHVMSIGVLLAWMQLMMLIGRLPTYGYYALMFSTVLKNVVKVLVTFICLVIGFALSFSVQFHTSEQFRYPWRALMKTTVMMMGEFEYGEMFADPQPDDDPQMQRLPTTSRFIFLLFILLASIVLMNLLIGLAVSDIQALQVEGHVRRLAKQADFLTHLERMTSHRVLKSGWFPQRLHRKLDSKRCVPPIVTIQPGHTAGQLKAAKLVRLLPMALKEAIVVTALNNEAANNSSEVSTVDSGPGDDVTMKDLHRMLLEIQATVAHLKASIHQGDGDVLDGALGRAASVRRQRV